jgi:hypothetical protein
MFAYSSVVTDDPFNICVVFFLVVSTKLKVSHDNNKFEKKKKREIEKLCCVHPGTIRRWQQLQLQRQRK